MLFGMCDVQLNTDTFIDAHVDDKKKCCQRYVDVQLSIDTFIDVDVDEKKVKDNVHFSFLQYKYWHIFLPSIIHHYDWTRHNYYGNISFILNLATL